MDVDVDVDVNRWIIRSSIFNAVVVKVSRTDRVAG